MSGQLDSTQLEVGQGQARSIETTEDGGVELSPQRVVVADKVYSNEKMAMLAFFNEMVTIRILPTSDRNAEQVFEINVNDHPTLFRRGGTYTIPRYTLDRIIKLKQTFYGQEEIINKDGVKTMIYPPTTALKYDYVVVRDDNPRGKEWERAMLAEPS